jgi:hypothetical protein
MATREEDATRWDALTERTREARERGLAKLGALSELVRTRSLVASFVRGEPLWPATMLPSLRSIHRGDRTLLVTNGLSDPFAREMHSVDHRPEIGCACELYAETTEPIARAPGGADGTSAPRHWLEWVLWCVGDWEAENRAAYDMTAQFGQITYQIPPCEELEGWCLSSGYVAVLIGVPSPDVPQVIALPSIEAALLSVKVLRPDELEHALALGNEGGPDLARRFAARGDHHLNWIDRPSVLAEPTWRWPGLEEAGWSMPAKTAPMPTELGALNRATDEMHASVVIVGSGARSFLAYVHAKSSGAPGIVDVTARDGAIGYLPLSIGAIRGRQTRLHLYSIADDDDGLASAWLARQLPHAAGVIVTQPISVGQPRLDPVVQAAASELSARRAPAAVAVIGDDALVAAWTAASGGRAPEHRFAGGDAFAFAALKEVVKETLRTLSGAPASTAPPSTASSSTASSSTASSSTAPSSTAPSSTRPPSTSSSKPWWKIW